MVGCCTCWRRFAAEWDKQRLDYDDFNNGEWINVFGSSSNRFLKDKTYFAAFRLSLALLMTGVYAWSLVESAESGEIACFAIFLTHWMLTLQLLYHWFAWWTTRQADLMASGKKSTSSAMPCSARATWILQDVVIPGSFLVFLLYWVLVAPTTGGPPEPISYFTHGVNFLVVIVDVYLSRQPYDLLHGIYLAILGIVYLLFTYIYYVSGGTDCSGRRYIYKSVDWNDPGSAGMLAAILVVVVVPFVNVLFWFVVSQCFPQNYHKDVVSPA